MTGTLRPAPETKPETLTQAQHAAEATARVEKVLNETRQARLDRLASGFLLNATKDTTMDYTKRSDRLINLSVPHDPDSFDPIQPLVPIRPLTPGENARAAERTMELPRLLFHENGQTKAVPEMDVEDFKTLIAERDAARAERDLLRVELAGAESRTQMILSHYHDVCAKLYAKSQSIVAQETVGDTTYSIFASDPNTIVADSKHTKADVKTPPPPPKPFPAGALNTPTKDPRRLGG